MYTIILEQTPTGWKAHCDGAHTDFTAKGATEAEALEGIVLLFKARPKIRAKKTPRKVS